MSVFDVFDKHLGETDADKQAMETERLIVNVTESLLTEMRHQDVTKTELARRLGKSKSFITSTLAGSRNMTLKTLSRIAYALGLRVQIKIERLAHHPSRKQRHQNIVFANFGQDSEDVVTSNAGTNARVAAQ
ncbi:MAG: hypothetical protein CMQ43_08650 [Gammaproteobacteria bacterium]|nr:hypothetical protein [Gammaproteobacteria bacterium]|tara:strand:+ start:2349 stop:2744 length:396 start_codon:yes stop_codon:yes gene_type:complete